MEKFDLHIKGIKKSFGDKAVLKDIDVTIKDGEFVTLLGPSGCGKTTLLRIIAGFEKADEGVVILGGEDISKKSPAKRDINTVFQSYALFPHLNVYNNIAFGLKSKKVPKDEIDKRVERKQRILFLEYDGDQHDQAEEKNCKMTFPACSYGFQRVAQRYQTGKTEHGNLDPQGYVTDGTGYISISFIEPEETRIEEVDDKGYDLSYGRYFYLSS